MRTTKSTPNFTNIFPILNLDVLDEYYTMFEIKATPSISEAEKQHIIKKLSYRLRHPVTIINYDEKPHLVLLNDQKVIDRLEERFKLVRKLAKFVPTDKVIRLDFSDSSPEIKKICRRVLGFALQGYLTRNHKLWQPSSGQPYFRYSCDATIQGIDVFEGFSARIVDTPDNGFGIAIDISTRYIANRPYPLYLDSSKFSRYFKGNHCLYKFGYQWYQISPHSISDDNVSEVEIPDGDNFISLISYIRRESSHTNSPELADLPEDASVLVYKANTDERRCVPAGMCFKVYDTDSLPSGNIHRRSILLPHVRLSKIRRYQSEFLKRFKVGENALDIGQTSIYLESNLLPIPDLEFGQGLVLSTRKSEGKKYTTFRNFGKAKQQCVFDPMGGFYSLNNSKLFLPQFVLIPRSINDKMGKSFLNELEQIVDNLYPTNKGWKPIVIPYEDKIQRNQDYVHLGLSIVKAFEDNPDRCLSSGKCLVMIPTLSKARRKHDQLAALICSELDQLGVDTTIIHSKTTEDVHTKKHIDGSYEFYIRPHKKGFYRSYLRNVALVKVLLNNEKYPFRLANPMNADLTIGIDVKHNTACYTFVNKHADAIRQQLKNSSSRERLSSDQVKAVLVNVIGELISEKAYGYPIKNIVIHRDGRLFDTELDGIEESLEVLKAKGVETISVLEIQKSSPVSIRIFKQSHENRTYNPLVGTYFMLNQDTAYLCTTGGEYKLPGTANPLCLNYAYGDFSFAKLIEDVFALANLTFTKLDSCSRVPLSIKLTDIRLRSIASEFNSDKLELLREVAQVQ